MIQKAKGIFVEVKTLNIGKTRLDSSLRTQGFILDGADMLYTFPITTGRKIIDNGREQVGSYIKENRAQEGSSEIGSE